MKKDLKVGDELSAVVDILRKNGLETLSYDVGIDSEADKEKPAYKLNKRIYITFRENGVTDVFIKALLMINSKFMSQGDKSILRLPLIEVNYAFNGKDFEYTVSAVNSSTFNTFNFLLTSVIDLYLNLDIKKETI